MTPPSLPLLAATFRAGERSPIDYLDELEERVQARERTLLALVPEDERFGRLRREARELLRRYPEPASRPPLFGVPVGVKDIFHVAGFVTRAGSKLPAELLQGPEAESVARLKGAGALILGKTVTTEFAYFAPGPTRNPHHPAHTPGGSSSGSAAAVAAGFCPLALGTQTIGSINRPAAFCGVVGFKPTQGRVSLAGVIPLAPSFDHVGCFVGDAAGAECVAPILCRDWRADVVLPERPTFGIPTGPYLEHASQEMRDRFGAVCRALAANGCRLKTVPAMPDFDAVCARHFLITNAEMARVHGEWFSRHRELYHPKTAAKLELGGAVSEEAQARAWRECDAFRGAMAQLMREHGIDAWISPAAIGPAPVGLESTGDPVMNLPWTQLGFPTVTLPAGRAANGLPLGVQLAAARDDDERLLHWAVDIERAMSGL